MLQNFQRTQRALKASRYGGNRLNTYFCDVTLGWDALNVQVSPCTIILFCIRTAEGTETFKLRPLVRRVLFPTVSIVVTAC